MSRTGFYNSVRSSLFLGKISTNQFNGLEALLDSIDKAGVTDKRWIAYMLATAYHETAKTMLPIREYGKGKGYDYGKQLKMSRQPYTLPNQIYYGRGYVQLTWYENYKGMGKLLGVDLLNNPDLALDHHIAAAIMIEGMTKGVSNWGDFTGKSLEQYFNDKVTDPVNARRIINGTDKANLIADYYSRFLKALNS